MPHDPVRAAHTKRWLALAQEDLAYAAHALCAQPPFLKDALFHCQQACEKALKALLTWHDTRFRAVHDLDELGKQCVDVAPTLARLVDRISSLTVYAVRLRYPGTDYVPSNQEAESALGLARELLEAILARLPDEVRP